MRSWWPALSKSIAGFLAGIAAVWVWPVNEPGELVASPAKPGEVSPAGKPGTAEMRGELARKLAARRHAAALSPADARAALSHFAPPVPDEEIEKWEELIKCWAEEEPEAALAWIQEVSRRTKGVPESFLYAALKPLARKNLPAALTAARRCVSDMTRARSVLPAAAAERDPRGTMEFLEKEPRFLRQFGTGALRVWMRSDPDAACAWLNASPSRAKLLVTAIPDLAEAAPELISSTLANLPEGSEERKSAMATLSLLEMQKDPAAALEKFKTLSRKDRESYMDAFTLHTSLCAEPAEISRLLAILDKEERSRVLFSMAGVVAGTDESRIMAVLQTEGLSSTERNQILASCTGLGPEYAAKFVEAAKDFPDQASWFWKMNLRQRPEETLPALTRMVEEGKVDNGMLLNILAGLNPHENLEWISALPAANQTLPRACVALTGALSDPAPDLSSLAKLDAEDGSVLLHRFFESQPGTHEQLAALIPKLPAAMQMEAIGNFNVEKDDVKALAPLMEKALVPGQADSPKTNSALRNITRGFPADGSAIQWLDSLPPGPAVDAVRPDTFWAWAGEDEAAASGWLESQPRDLSGRDHMIRGLASALSSHNPESAWRWALSIQEEGTRESMLRDVLSKWQALDPASASAAESAREP